MENPLPTAWCLVDPGTGHSVALIAQSPFRVGRHPTNDLALTSPSVSKFHAEFRLEGHHLWFQDLSSTNGTFINGDRIHAPAKLKVEDLLRFGEVSFTLKQRFKSIEASRETQAIDSSELTPAEQKQRLELIISARALRTEFQPIVRLADDTVVGYECLARGTGLGLDANPAALFSAAAMTGLAGTLSEVCREEAYAVNGLSELMRGLPEHGAFGLFSNLHEDEFELDQSLERLAQLKQSKPDVPLVIEISERSILEAEATASLMSQLHGVGVAVAFDDFGAGVDRLHQLANCTPDLLKFDRLLIDELNGNNTRMEQLLKRLVTMAAELGCTTVAEGIETETQHSKCIDLGFDLAQGFLLGRPAPLSTDIVDTVASKSTGA